MSDSDPQEEYFDHMEVARNIISLNQKLRRIIEHKEETGFSDIDLEISALMHQMTYFSTLVQLFYPLETTFERMKLNPTNPNDDETIKAQVIAIDFNCRKSFLVLTAFSLETLLMAIAEKHSISLNPRDSITKNYLTVMDYFEIDHGEYEDLLKIFHYTRNTLHSGTKIKKSSPPLTYKGKTFTFEIGQKFMEYTTWNYFTYFTSEIIEIFEKIYKSTKFNN